MKSLIIGAGEVGTSLFKVISPCHETRIKDLAPMEVDGVEVLHICYPDSDRFVEITKNYILKYKPKLTIVNSSVKVGTTLELGKEVVYSPIRGRHPNLESEIKIYAKLVAGFDVQQIELAREYFELCGLNVIASDDPSGLELCKLLSNIHMGLEIAWRQEVSRILKNFNVGEPVYQHWEETYQQGYLDLNQPHLIRPIMRPDPIGGHCILPCTEILKGQFSSKAFDFILESNEKRKGEVNEV